MSDLNLQGYRVKAVPQAPLNINLVSSDITFDDVVDSAVEYIRLEAVAPIPATIPILTEVSTTLGNAIITGNFSSYNIKPGDGVSGTNIAFGAKVASVINATTISLDQNCTGSGSSNDVIITPPTFDANLFSIVRDFTVSGSVLSMRIRVGRADGKVNNDTNSDGVDNSSHLDYSVYVDKVVQIDLDTFLTNLRVDRT